MKLVERADGLMQHAEVLYNKHRPIMRPDDCMLAEDRMTRWVGDGTHSLRAGLSGL
jgi:hypothetical protein